MRDCVSHRGRREAAPGSRSEGRGGGGVTRRRRTGRGAEALSRRRAGRRRGAVELRGSTIISLSGAHVQNKQSKQAFYHLPEATSNEAKGRRFSLSS